ncbi:hypothetical protein PHMEG_0004683 [Phytophthora megakarya]|uniref:Dynein axonemal light chain 1 n=1 Tax=Phytophthora megakarya TaxID=4795 RepID=A0A225WTD0_9STRA|nr:hypothetical protein PHMEG_0004683 [Phytophthora megakarya]
MDRLEVRALLGAVELAPVAAPVDQGIAVDDSLDEETFLKALEETLQQHAPTLGQQFLVLSVSQVDRLAFRLHDALVPKRDLDTHVVQAWTIQPQLQLKVKASAHIQVLKLSTILREVQRLRLHQSMKNDTQVPIEVEIFPSLRVIDALNTESTALQNVHYFAGQLRELHIEHTEMMTLTELISPKENKPWRKLLKLQINCCMLQVVDESVNLLRAIRTLDLGWNQIDKVEANVTTKSLEVLNLCHNQLREVPPIQSLRSLKELDLAVNHITSLKGLEKLTALERLDISHNLINDITGVNLLTKLSRLMYVKMEFNPIARRPDYRREVLFYLGEPIELDGQRWSDAELSSMKNRRMLIVLDGVKEGNSTKGSIWGQSVQAHVYPRVRGQSGIVVKNPKLVLGYPSLPRSSNVPAHFVEIRNPPLTLPAKSSHWSNTAGRSADNKLNTSNPPGNSQDSQGARTTIQTVDDYFRTQRDVIEEDSDDSNTGKSRKRSRKYTASDFMRDFEEEELLVRERNDIDHVDLLVAHDTSQTQIASHQKPERTVDVRVLLSAKEAAELDIHFGIDGVPANVEMKPREFIERFTVSDGKNPITVTRWLPDVVAVGTSMYSSRAKIITMKLQPRWSPNVAEAAYQFEVITSLEIVLKLLVARLYQQYRGRIVICNCANCGALSLLTPKYPARMEDGMLVVYSCLICLSCNVRETSFKKFVAICANEGIAIPRSIPLAPPPWETTTERFYIEEPAATDLASGTDMRECVMVSCNSVREIAFPSGDFGTGGESNDIIDHAVR